MKKISLLFYLTFVQFSLQAQNYITLKGNIQSQEDGKAIPFAHIGIINKSIGTFSNEQGSFIFKIPKASQNDTLHISAIGFKTKKIALKSIKKTFLNIRLKVDIGLLEEITISEESALSIVEKAIKKIPENYDLGSVAYQAFAREKIFLADEKIALIEAVLDVYQYKTKHPRFETTKLRAKAYNEIGHDWLKKERMIGLSALNYYNINFLPEYLKLKNLKRHDYILKDIEIRDKDTIYIIKPKHKKDKSYYTNTEIHISSDNYAMLYYGTSYTIKDVISGSRVYFKKYRNKYYLNRVSRTLTGIDNYTLNSGKKTRNEYEYIVTQIRPNTPRIPKKEEDNMVGFVKPRMGDFNDAFWDNYNVIKLSEQDTEFISKSDTSQNQEVIVEKEKTKIVIDGHKVRESKRFSLAFLDTPEYQEEYIGTEKGTIKYQQLSLEQELDLGDAYYDATIYTLSILDFPLKYALMSKDKKSELFVSNFLKKLELDIDKRENIELQGYKGEILEGELDQIYHHTRYFQVKNRLYILSILKPDTEIEEEIINKFMGSFKILK